MTFHQSEISYAQITWDPILLLMTRLIEISFLRTDPESWTYRCTSSTTATYSRPSTSSFTAAVVSKRYSLPPRRRQRSWWRLRRRRRRRRWYRRRCRRRLQRPKRRPARGWRRRKAPPATRLYWQRWRSPLAAPTPPPQPAFPNCNRRRSDPAFTLHPNCLPSAVSQFSHGNRN